MVALLNKLLSMENEGELIFNNSSAKDMVYERTLDETLKNLERALLDEDVKELYFLAPRVMNGFIDYSIGSESNEVELKKNLLNLVNNTYLGNFGQAGKIIKSLKMPKKIGETFCKEDLDKISWHAYSPSVAKRLIQRIQSSGYKPEVMLIDGHGGYRSGLLVSNYFNSDAFLLRNSLDSKRDKFPQLLRGEDSELRNEIYRKNVLIYGEDSSTGRALNSLKKLAKRTGCPLNIRTASSLYLGDGDSSAPDYFGERKTRFS